MKIILEAFNGKMRSDPMDVPDNIGRRFKMTLPQSPEVIIDFNGSEIDKTPRLNTVCTFVATGKAGILEDNESVFFYTLAEITN